MSRQIFSLTVLFLGLSVSSLFADMKRYDEKSGQIMYEITGGGTMMGVPTKISGTTSLVFKNYGSLEVIKEKRVQVTMDEKETEEVITKFDNGTVYSVESEEQVIFKQEVTVDSADFMILNNGDESLESIGGEKIGTEKIAGYKCDIWQFSDAEICIYKGIPLKTQSESMGIKETQVATSIKFDVSIPDKEFDLPSYPVKTIDDFIQSGQEQINNMSPEDKKMMEEMMNNMKEMFNN